jgi:ABC-type Na+ efflux pump permease subunit
MDNFIQRLIANLRIVWTIASKDIIDALRNKTTLSILIASLTIMLTGRALPLLTRLSGTPIVYIYDQGESTLSQALIESEEIRVRMTNSREELEALLTGLGLEALGLVVPADFDRTLESGAEPQLEGIVTWSNRFAASKLQAEWEDRLSELLDNPVRIDVEGHIVYPSHENDGRTGMITSTIVMIIATLGIFMAPYLLFEEKRTRTIDVLRVSPATTYQIIAGKAIAGLSYTLTAAGIALAFNFASVVHWGIAILATIIAGLFAIGIGLVMGSIFDNAQDMGLWIGIPMGLVFAPVILAMSNRTPPEPLATIINWVPTVPVIKAFNISFSGDGSQWVALRHLLMAAGVTLPIYLLVVWIARRADR